MRCRTDTDADTDTDTDRPWNLNYSEEMKNGLILPTGQWYAPSAVINDAWYCMILNGIEWYCIVLHGIAL